MENNTRYFDYNNPNDFLDKVKELELLLSPKGFQVFLYGGTLLGSIRNNDFIPHDDDIDLFYISKQSHRKAVLVEFDGIIKPLLENNGWEVKFISWRLNGPQVMMGQYHVIKDNISLDLWTAWFDNQNKFNVTMTVENSFITKNDILPAKQGIIKDYSFNIPNNSEMFLKYLYGNDWRIPDSKYKIPCNKNFLQKSMLKVIDQFGWAYFFIAKAQQKHSYHKIAYKRLKDMDNHKIIEDVIYFHSPCMGNPEINEIINKKTNRKKTKIIGAYGGENDGRYSDADLIVTISFPFLSKLKTIYPDKPCIFLPEAIDTEYFYNKKRNNKKFEVGYVGRPCKVKRMHLLDKLDFEIKKQINWGKDYFTEDRTLDEVRDFYSSIDCLVLTSQSECMPRVVLEAMSMRLPVISTDVGCMRMLLDPEWIVPNSEEEDIVKNINDRLNILNKYPEIRKKVGFRNRQHIKKYFDWEKIQQIWDDVINALVLNDYEKIKNIGNELENQWAKLYETYTIIDRVDLSKARLQHRSLKSTKEIIFDLFPVVTVLNETCLKIIQKRMSNTKNFYFGVSKKQFNSINTYLLSNNFVNISKNRYAKKNYIVHLNIYNGKTKTHGFGDIKTNVPFPVVSYLQNMYGNNWQTVKTGE